MYPALDDAFGDVMYELARLGRCDLDLPGLHGQVRAVDLALTELCEALETARPSAPLVRPAFMAVLALGQMLDGACGHDRRTDDALDFTRSAIGELLDTLEPYVGHADRALRRVLIGGETLEEALERLFSA
jgi:hypothetical protein